MINKRLQFPRFQSDLYRDYYYKILRWLMISSVLIVLLVLGNLYLIFFSGNYRYYVSTTDGQLYQWCANQGQFKPFSETTGQWSCQWQG